MKLKWGFKKVSWRACLIFIVFLLILFNSLSSNYSDFHIYDSESSKRCTLRLLLMCLEESLILEIGLSWRGK